MNSCTTFRVKKGGIEIRMFLVEGRLIYVRMDAYVTRADTVLEKGLVNGVRGWRVKVGPLSRRWQSAWGPPSGNPNHPPVC